MAIIGSSSIRARRSRPVRDLAAGLIDQLHHLVLIDIEDRGDVGAEKPSTALSRKAWRGKGVMDSACGRPASERSFGVRLEIDTQSSKAR
jgi:hypothetical protein